MLIAVPIAMSLPIALIVGARMAGRRARRGVLDAADDSVAPTMSATEISATGRGLTIVVNGSAGDSATDAAIAELTEGLPDAVIVAVDEPERLDVLMRKAADDARALGVLGGDGSINTAAAIALEADIPLAVFPGGTLNHFARDLGFETIDDAMCAVRDRRLRRIDVGVIDHHTFVNTASIGSYPQLVELRERYEDAIGKWPAMFIALLKILVESKPFTLEIDGIERRIWMMFIGNCAYDPPGFAPLARRRLDDGLLDVRIVDADRPLARTRVAWAMLTGRLDRSAVYARSLVDELAIDTGERQPLLASDGEVFSGSKPAFRVSKSRTTLSVFTTSQ